MASAQTFEARRVDIFVQKPDGGVVLQLIGEEDKRMLIVVDSAGCASLADALFAAGFGGSRGARQ